MSRRSDSYYAKHIEPLEYADWLGEQAYYESLEREPQARREVEVEYDPTERGAGLDPKCFRDGWGT